MTETILTLLRERRMKQLRALTEQQNPVDLAAVLDELVEAHDITREQLLLCYRILPKETAAEVFVEMSSDLQEALITGFSDSELREVLDDLFRDDAVDIMEEMPANVVHRMLRNVDADTRWSMNQLLNYPDDSAGSIMTIEFVDLKQHMTVADAFRRIREIAVDKETVYTCYVMGADRRLLGLVTVKDLLLAREDAVVGDVMEQSVISVTTHEDREEVARLFSRYDLLAMPVVDSENRLVGIITVDDVIDVLQQEATEDIEMTAAIRPSDRPYLRMNTWELFRSRFPWLLLLMVSSTFTGLIIRSYEGALAANAALTAFVPMLMGTGGNSGSQTSVTIIRGLSLGEIEPRDLIRILWKELRVAVVCGAALAVASFAKLLWLDRVSAGVAAVVSVTMLATVLVAKVVGCLLPMLSKKLGLDPAVMSAPFITTIVDALSLIIYFAVASSMLGLGA